MWKEFISNLKDDCDFQQPVTLKNILEVEKDLGVCFPDDLKCLLCETDGIKGGYSIDIIWTLKRIRQENIYFRGSEDFKELYMSFDCLLFFADAGNGDQFAYAIQHGKICRDDIYVWNHEDDSRTWVAPSLDKFIQWWLDGTIKV